MNANDAVRLSKKSFEEKKQRVYPNILKAIEDKASEGYYRLSVDLPIFADIDSIVTKLRELGYNIIVQKREIGIAWGDE